MLGELSFKIREEKKKLTDLCFIWVLVRLVLDPN